MKPPFVVNIKYGGAFMLKNLKKLRTEKGMSQKQLADVISFSQQSINKYENHDIEPDIATLIKIADFFDTSVDYLIGHSDVRRKIEAVQFNDLNTDESKLISEYRKLSSKKKQSLHIIMESYNE